MRFEYRTLRVSSLLLLITFVGFIGVVIDMSMNRIAEDQRQTAIDIMGQTKSTWAQKRAMLLKKLFLRSTVDELEVLDDSGELLSSSFCNYLLKHY
jgi:hypothetical protein